MGTQIGSATAWGIAMLAIMMATGCAGKSGSVTGQSLPEERIAAYPVKEITQDEQKSASTSSRPQANATLQPIGRGGVAGAGASADLGDVLFDFDQATLRLDAITTVEANAKRIQDGSAKRILLEGRGDEVGTSEYNLVLGERRAQGVKRYLSNLGLDTSKIDTTSYGKDSPLCLQHSTECWQKNRSVHFNPGE